jgi:hypothetical protein
VSRSSTSQPDVCHVNFLITDTDSIIFATHFADLESCLRSEYAGRWPEIKRFLFEDENSPKEQSGLLKVRCCFIPGACKLSSFARH